MPKRLSSCFPTAITTLALAACLLLPAGSAWAFACTHTAGNANWATAGTWTNCNGTTPQPGDTVTITAGTVTLNTSATIASLTINGGALTFGNSTTIRTLTVNGDITVATGATINIANNTVTHALNVSGNITNNGTLDLRLDANSLCTLAFTGGGAHTIGGTSAGTTEFYNVTVANDLTINKSGAAITQTGTLGVTGNLVITAGTLNLADATTVAGTTSITGTLGNTTATGTRTFTGAVTINSGGTMSETAAAAVVFGNNLTNNGNTYTASTGLHTFSGAAAQILGTSAISFGGAVTGTSALTINKASGAVTVTGAFNVGATGLTVTAGTLNLANTATITGPTSISGTLAHTTATGTRTFTGAVTINSGGTMSEAAAAALAFGNNLTIASGGTMTEFGAATVTIAGDLSNSGAYTASTGLHTFSGATAQILGTSAVSFGGAVTGTSALTINKASGAVTVTGAFNVGATGLTVTAGTLNLANTATVTGPTSISGTLAHTTATGTRTFTGAVTINSGGTLSEAAAAALAFGNNLTIASGGTMTEFGAATVTIAGDLSNSGAYTASTGLHTFSGATAQILGTSAVSFGGAVTGTSALTINKASGAVTVTGAFTVGATGLTVTAGTLNLANTAAVTGPTSISGTLAHTTATGTRTFTGNVTINSGGIWSETAAAAISFAGNLQNNGTMTASTAAHTFSGAAKTLGGTSIIAIPSVTLSGTYTNNGTFTVATTLAGAGTLTNGAAGILNIGAATVTPTLTATAVGNTVNYTAATAQTLKVTAYHHLNLSGGAKTFGAIATVAGNLALSGTATATTGANLTIGGNLDVGSGTTFTSANFTNLVTGTTSVSGTLAHSGVAAKTYTGDVTINGGGAWTNAGNAPITFGGSFTQGGTFTSGTGIHTFNGGSPQTITGTPTFQRLTVASGGGVTLATGSVTVSTALALTNGTLSTGTNTLVASANCPGSVSRTGGYVIGNLRLTFPAASTTCTFHVGSGATYAPIQITNTGAGTLTGSTTGSDYPPPPATANIDPAKDANRYWTLWATGDTIASTSYTPTFTFANPGDLDAGAIPTSFIVAKLLSGVWSNPTMGTAGATSTSTAAILTGFGGTPNVFVVGQPPAVNCTSNVASGNWNSAGTWIFCRLGVPLASDPVTILNGHTVTLNVTTPIIGNLSNAGTLGNSGTNTLSVGGSFINTGTVSLGASNVDLYGDFTNNGGANFNPGGSDSGTWTFRGTTLQNINSSGILTIFPKLTLNNSLGIALNASSTVKTLLTLTNGYISTGTNILSLTANCLDVSPTNGTSWARTNGFVAGNLRLSFPSAVSPGVACTYPVGSGTSYAPIGLTMISTGGTLTGSTTGSEHPQIFTASIDSTKDANRYWSLWVTGDTIAATSYGATFNFVAGDLDAGAIATNFVLGKYASSAWTMPTPVVASATATSVSSIAGPISATTDFAVGEAGVFGCYSDGFTGADGSSPGANWSVGNKSGTFGNPIIFGNRLRLTNASASVATWATLQRLIPAAGNKVTVQFDYFAYGGTHADGAAVILSDASVAPQAGAFGGSLGYAQKGETPVSDCTVPGGCPGFTGGWLGVALDEYGNFSAATEGRFGGSASAIPNSVAIRGSGSGLSGYRFLKGTGTLSPAVDAVALPPHRYRIVVDHTDGVHVYVSVERDVSGGGTSYSTLIGCAPGQVSGCTALDVKDPGYSQNPIPASFNLSFTGSTGAATNIHEIDNLSICTVQALVPPTLHHIKIEHPGNSCTSNPATVTVKACADAGCTALYMNSVTVDLTPNAGGGLTWAPTEPITFSGGATTLTLANTTANTQTLGGTATSPTTGNATQCFSGATQTCSLTYSVCNVDAVEVSPTSAAGQPIYTKLANTLFNLHVVRTGGGTQDVSAVELVDASTGTNGLCNTYTPLTSTISPTTFTLNAGNPRQSVAFTYNNAAPNVRVRLTTASPVPSCSSDNFAIRPLSFTVTSSANPVGPPGGTLGVNILRAGTDTFSITASTATNGYTGTPKLNSTDPSMVTTGQTNLGTLTTALFPAATAGTSQASGFKYSEVGTINLAQNAIYDDTFADVDNSGGKSDCTQGFNNMLSGGKYSCSFGSAAAGPFGRFVPDHFTVVGAVSNACPAGTFTYMGQTFTLAAAKVVEARNKGDVVTQNYVGAYATVDFAAENADNGTNLTARLTVAGMPGTWILGAYTLTNTNLVFSRPALAPDGAFDTLDIGLTVSDADVSTVPIVKDADMNPAVAGGSSFAHRKLSGSPLRMRYGMLKLDNAYGSELLNVRVPVRALYWGGGGWQLNSADSCTSIPANALVLGNYLGALNGTNMGAGHLPGTATTLSGGAATIAIAKPAPAAVGSVDLAINLGATLGDANCIGALMTATGANLAWLRGNWCGAAGFVRDPSARIRLGSPKAPYIYLREKY